MMKSEVHVEPALLFIGPQKSGPAPQQTLQQES